MVIWLVVCCVCALAVGSNDIFYTLHSVAIEFGLVDVRIGG